VEWTPLSEDLAPELSPAPGPDAIGQLRLFDLAYPSALETVFVLGRGCPGNQEEGVVPADPVVVEGYVDHVINVVPDQPADPSRRLTGGENSI
jgi:hypothetical protein